MTEQDNTTAEDTTPNPNPSALIADAVSQPFPLTVEGQDEAAPEFKADQYIDDCIDQLSTNVDYHYGTYTFDGGALGDLEIEIEDLEIDLQDVVRDNWCGSAPDWGEYMTGASNDVGQTTLGDVRKAWMAHTGRSIEDYLWAVTVEAMGAARNAEATVGLELVEGQQALTQQAEQDRDKAQAEYGKADRDRQRLEADVKWAAGVIGTLQVAGPIQQKAEALVRVIEEAERMRLEALALGAEEGEVAGTEEAQA